MADSLKHYGILGMRWGVRRYQNKDGTRTSAGKKRVKVKAGDLSNEELTSKVKRLTLEKQYKNLSKETAKPTKLEKTKKIVDATSTLANQMKNLNNESINKSRTREKLDLSKMTDQQLRDRINRANLERQYSDLFAKEEATISRGRQYFSKVIDIGGGALAAGSSALGIALAIKELKK